MAKLDVVKHSKPLAVYLDPLDFGTLKEIAYQDRTSMSEWARNLIAAALRKRVSEVNTRQLGLPGVAKSKRRKS